MAQPVRLALCDPQGRELAVVGGIEIAPFFKVKDAHLITDSLNEFPDHAITIEGADAMAAAFMVPHNTVKVSGIKGKSVWGVITDPQQQVSQAGNVITLKLPNITEQCHLSSVGIGYVREGAISAVGADIAAHRYGWTASYVVPANGAPVINATPIHWAKPPNADAQNTALIQGSAIEQSGDGTSAIALSTQAASAFPASVSFLAAQANKNIVCGICAAGSYQPGPYDIQYAVFCTSDARYYVYEPLAGVQTLIGSYSIGDIFQVVLAPVGTQWFATYMRNASVVYSHVIAAPPASVVGKGWVLEQGGRIENAMLTYPAPPDQAWWKATSENDTVLGALYNLVTTTGIYLRQAKTPNGDPLRAFEIGPFGNAPTILFTNLRGGDANRAANEPNSDVRIIDSLDQTVEGSRMATIATPLGGGPGDSQVSLRRLWRILNDPSYPYYGQYLGSGTMLHGQGGVFPEYNPRYPIGTPAIPAGTQQALVIGKPGGNIYTGVGWTNSDLIVFNWQGQFAATGLFPNFTNADGSHTTLTAETVTAALESIPLIGVGNVVVEGPMLTYFQDAAIFLVTLAGSLALSAQPTLGVTATATGIQTSFIPALNPRAATSDGRFIYDMWDAAVYDPTNEFRVDGTDSSVTYGTDGTETSAIIVERALYSSMVEKFKRQSQAHSAITVTLLGTAPLPRVGEMVHVDYRDIRTRRDGTQYLAAKIKDDYRVMRHELDIQGDKITASCLLSNRSRYLDDPNAMLSDSLNQFDAARSVPQTTSSPVVIGPIEKEADSRHPHTIRIAIPPEVSRISRAPIHVEVVDPRSTVDTRVADSGDHSHQIYIAANAISFSVDVSPPVGAHLHTAPMPGHSHDQINLSGFSLSGINLKDYSLSGINLKDLGFSGIDLKGLSLSGIDINGHNQGDSTPAGRSGGGVDAGGSTQIDNAIRSHNHSILINSGGNPGTGDHSRLIYANHGGQSYGGPDHLQAVDNNNYIIATSYPGTFSSSSSNGQGSHPHSDSIHITGGGTVGTLTGFQKLGTAGSPSTNYSTARSGDTNYNTGRSGNTGFATGGSAATNYGTAPRQDANNKSKDDNRGSVHVSVTNQPVTLSTGNQGSAGMVGGTDGRHSHALQLGLFEPKDLNISLPHPPIHLEIDSGDGNFVDRTAQLGGPWETDVFDIPDASLLVSASGKTIRLRFTPAASSGNTTGLCAIQVSGTWTFETNGTGSVVYAASPQ